MDASNCLFQKCFFKTWDTSSSWLRHHCVRESGVTAWPQDISALRLSSSSSETEAWNNKYISSSMWWIIATQLGNIHVQWIRSSWRANEPDNDALKGKWGFVQWDRKSVLHSGSRSSFLLTNFRVVSSGSYFFSNCSCPRMLILRVLQWKKVWHYDHWKMWFKIVTLTQFTDII